MKKSDILEQLSRYGPYAVFPETLKNKRIVLWALSRDLSNVEELSKCFVTLRREGLFLRLGTCLSLATANGKLRRVREEASSHQLRQIFLLPPKR